MSLQVRQLHAYYGKSHILHGLDFEIRPGELVALLGRNGSGRSTLGKALMGLVRAEGSVTWKGEQLVGRPSHQISRLGMGYVPESRDVFAELTVHENLLLGRKRRPGGRWDFADMYDMFPRLKEREHTDAGLLSGGEQQMLTLCRTLMGEPEFIIIDEPTEGLAPKIVEDVGRFLERLRDRGISILLIEQKLTIALGVSSRAMVMGHGDIVFDGTPQALQADAALRREWLEV
jgi:branched-chain amino acid transport system ATP-binding protein